MSAEKTIQHSAFFNLLAALVSCLLCGYVVEKWLTLTATMKFGVTGWTLLVAATSLAIVATMYLLLAWLLRFRYKSNISWSDSKRLRVLHYDERQNEKLVVVWYASGLWVTNEKSIVTSKN